MARSRVRSVVVEAVGDRASQGAVQTTDGRWQGVVFFRPWRVLPDGKPSKEVLRVLLSPQRTSGPAMAACRRVKEGQAYRFKADLHAKAPNRLWSAELRGRLTTVSTTSDTVAKADAKLTETLRVTDPVLGRLVRKPRQDQFDGRIEVLGRRVPLCVWTSVERASALFDRVQSKLPKVPQFVARTMLPLANDVWLDTPISEPQLLRRLKLTEVSIDDTLSLSFSCGDTFGDHGIAVEIGPRGGLRPPKLQ